MPPVEFMSACEADVPDGDVLLGWRGYGIMRLPRPGSAAATGGIPMQRYFVKLVATVLLAAARPAPAANHDVAIQNLTFTPQHLTITAGDSVTWTNHDGALHVVTSGTNYAPDGMFSSDLLLPDDAYAHQFDTLGTFYYFCAYHTFAMQHGNDYSVTVTSGAAVVIASANPPTVNPYDGTLPFRDVLQNTTAALVAQGIGVVGTPDEGPVSPAPFRVTFSGTPSPAPTTANIGVSCTDSSGNGPGDCPAVASVSGSGAGPYLVTLSASPPPRECINFTFAGTSPGQRLNYQVLPGDVNMNGSTTGQDVLSLVLAINAGGGNDPANLARYDINRNGATTGQDVLRLVQLLNGGMTVAPSTGFNGATVAACP